MIAPVNEKEAVQMSEEKRRLFAEFFGLEDGERYILMNPPKTVQMGTGDGPVDLVSVELRFHGPDLKKLGDRIWDKLGPKIISARPCSSI